MVRIRLVGRLGLEVDGRTVPLPPSRRARALLAFLALHPGPHPRGDVAAMLWPDVLDSSARTSLRGALAELRRALGPAAADLLRTGRESVELVRGPQVWIDTEALSQLAAAGRWRQALDLDEGRLVSARLLPEVEDEWVETDRDDHRRAVLDVLERAAGAAEADGDVAAAVEAARRRVRLDPLSEQAGRELVRLLDEVGDRSGALATAAALADRLRRELHVAPGPETDDLVARIRAGQGARGAGAASVPTASRGGESRARRAAARPAPPELPLPAAVTLHDTPPLGREAELATLDDVCGRSVQLGVQVALLAGDAGIGKTTLAAAAARRAAGRGTLVLHGRCDEDGLVPFAPWVEGLTHAVGHLDDGALSRAVGDGGAELALLLPELRRRRPDLAAPVAVEPDTERWRLFEAAAAMLGRLAEDAPLLVVVDDVHWADRSTLLLLRHLVRARRTDPLTLLLTCRDAEVSADDPLHDVLAALHRDHVLTRLAVRGLGESAVAEMVARRRGGPADRGFVHALFAETEGNPFFVEEILRNLPTRTRPDLHLPTGFEVPQGVQDVVRRRLGRLPESVRDVVLVASVLGRDFELGVLDRVAEPSGDALLDALDRAIQASVVEETGVGRYSFTHALVRSAVYDSLSLTRRARLHARVARALEDLPGPGGRSRAGELAFHYLAAADDSLLDRAVECCRQAYRDDMATLAYGEAAATARRAVDAVTAAGRTGPDTVGLLLDLGDALSRAGDVDAARGAFGQAADLARSLGDAASLAAAALGFAGPSWRTFGEVDEPAVRLLDEALEVLEARDGALRAMVQARLAIKLYFARQPDRVAALTRESLEVARALGDAEVLAAALEARLWASWQPDGVDERLAAAGELLDLAETHGLPELAAVARRWRVVALLESARFADADTEARLHARTARELRLPYELMYVAVFATAKAVLEGRLDDARREAAVVADHGDLRGGADALQFSGVHAVTLAYETSLRSGADTPPTRTQGASVIPPPRTGGAVESSGAAVLHAQQVGELVEPIRRFADGYPSLAAWRTALALALADAGHVEDAVAELDRTWPPEEALPFDAVWLPAVVLQAITVLRLGLLDRAGHLYAVLLPYAGRAVVMGAGGAVWGTVDLHLGVLAAALGRVEDALAHLDLAVRQLRDLGAVPALALAEQGRAGLLAATAARPGDR